MISVSNSISIGRPAIQSSAPSLLLDQYGSGIEAAYSLRKLSSSYEGSAVRVRESTFNTEADIGFDEDGNFDTASLVAHVGSAVGADGYVVKWYDQSGNSNDAVQTSSSSQPVIAIDNSALFQPKGGRATIAQVSGQGNPSNQFLDTPTINAVHNFIVFYQPAVGGGRAYYAESASAALKHDGFRIDYEDGVNTRIDGVTNIRTDYVLSEVKVLSGTATSIINGSTDASGTANVLQVEALMGYPTAGGGIIANMQEMIFFSSDKSSDASDISTDINTYYSIY